MVSVPLFSVLVALVLFALGFIIGRLHENIKIMERLKKEGYFEWKYKKYGEI